MSERCALATALQALEPLAGFVCWGHRNCMLVRSEHLGMGAVPPPMHQRATGTAHACLQSARQPNSSELSRLHPRLVFAQTAILAGLATSCTDCLHTVRCREANTCVRHQLTGEIQLERIGSGRLKLSQA